MVREMRKELETLGRTYLDFLLSGLLFRHINLLESTVLQKWYFSDNMQIASILSKLKNNGLKKVQFVLCV